MRTETMYLTEFGALLRGARRTLLLEGRSPLGLHLSAADLLRFDLPTWTGLIFGMTCDQPATERPRTLADAVSHVPVISGTGTFYCGGRL